MLRTTKMQLRCTKLQKTVFQTNNVICWDMNTTFAFILLWIGSFEIAKLLIEAGIDINHQDANGSAAIHISSEHGTSKVADLLVKARADLNIRDKKGYTPYTRAKDSDFSNTFDSVLFSNAKKMRYYYGYIEDDTNKLLAAFRTGKTKMEQQHPKSWYLHFIVFYSLYHIPSEMSWAVHT